MKILAISGKASSGKDTVAGVLKSLDPEMLSVNVHIFPFAEELKSIASRLWNLDPEVLNTLL